ncbi:MAG: histidine phosphotransferase family protein [Alphaproteobacteria bacterium]
MDINFATTLSEYITTRICHDLSGATSAITNGVEFLSGDDDFASEAKGLIEMSANTVSARIKLFRLAFGKLDERCRDFNHIKEILENYLCENPKINISWITNSDFQKDETAMITGRLILLLGIIAPDVIPRGGILKINPGFSDAEFLKISISSEKILINKELEQIFILMNNEKTNIDEFLAQTTPKNVNLTCSQLMVEKIGAVIKVINKPEYLEITVKQK